MAAGEWRIVQYLVMVAALSMASNASLWILAYDRTGRRATATLVDKFPGFSLLRPWAMLLLPYVMMAPSVAAAAVLMEDTGFFVALVLIMATGFVPPLALSWWISRVADAVQYDGEGENGADDSR